MPGAFTLAVSPTRRFVQSDQGLHPHRVEIGSVVRRSVYATLEVSVPGARGPLGSTWPPQPACTCGRWLRSIHVVRLTVERMTAIGAEDDGAHDYAKESWSLSGCCRVTAAERQPLDLDDAGGRRRRP